jgi:hypothetical protein
MLYQAVPPDPAQLARIAGTTGGRAVEARSAAEVQEAVDSLLGTAGLQGERRDLTLLAVAAALLLAAVAAALSRPGRASAPEAVRRWVPSVALLLIAGTTAAAWTEWQPTASPPAAAAAAADIPEPAGPVPPLSRPMPAPMWSRRSPSTPSLPPTARPSAWRPTCSTATGSSPPVVRTSSAAAGASPLGST